MAFLPTQFYSARSKETPSLPSKSVAKLKSTEIRSQEAPSRNKRRTSTSAYPSEIPATTISWPIPLSTSARYVTDGHKPKRLWIVTSCRACRGFSLSLRLPNNRVQLPYSEGFRRSQPEEKQHSHQHRQSITTTGSLSEKDKRERKRRNLSKRGRACPAMQAQHAMAESTLQARVSHVDGPRDISTRRWALHVASLRGMVSSWPELSLLPITAK